MNLIGLMIMQILMVLKTLNEMLVLLSVVHISVCGDSLKRIWRVNLGGPGLCLENKRYRVSGMGIDTSALRHTYIPALV